MIYLTILNTIGIIYILFKDKISYSIERTFFNHTILGIQIWFNNSGLIYIPLRNRKKIELKEETERLLMKDHQGRIQQLNAMFSWLKTKKEVNQFERDYSKFEPEFVQKLVSNFKSKS